ncbi:hypothetical protein PTTG_27546 [Puccinia triticina 1-1 BBBD Race 1]|uniref:Uncharacterized protein n=1 Tax=Puccinia triticina (isolate 1-1 / race 1 (BBBD)) TaxID=630390 RepID=A0A180GJ59_PUCT1|nr:hypothetical protein PTTG_27546 [Puccinia triticina 1-1 BBBD Race 1]
MGCMGSGLRGASSSRRGIGPHCELAFSRISILFAEACGTCGTSVSPGTASSDPCIINQIGFFLGFRVRIFDNGLPPNSSL